MKMLKVLCFIATIVCSTVNLSNAENEASFNLETGVLNIPKLILFSDSYELNLLFTGQDFTIKDIKQNKIENTASGTFSYNQNTKQLHVNFTQSTFTDDGPPVGSHSLSIVSLTEKELVMIDPSGDQTAWDRISGTGQTLTGNWQEKDSASFSKNIMVFGEDGGINYAKEYSTFTLKNRQINIDGNYSDWSDEDRVFLDNNGPECDDLPGRDLKEVYIAKDEIFIYLRFVLNGQMDNSFQYLFGDNDLHMRVYKSNSGFRVSYSSGTGMTSNSSIDLPESFIHVDGNQFEAKLFHVDRWKNKNFNAWVDQGRETICRDNVSLPVLLVK
ncbi:MAG: hypothetical protein HQK61_05165 [Desulfamplus sp.]|nr:hypothetical protein [Desulfamplus sp.]